jgi:signal transduction histidine kinase
MPFLLPRRLSLNLLAPTVLISLGLVGACAFGMFYLSSLHLYVARDLSENVRSTQAAAHLEATAGKLVTYLRGSHADAKLFSREVNALNEEASALLAEAVSLANHETEQKLVKRIDKGLNAYLKRFQQAEPQTTAQREELAELVQKGILAPALELRHFNADLVEISDRENRDIVERLRWGLVAVGIGLPLGGLVLGYAVARRLRHSIFQLSVRIRDAAGRLSRELGSVTVEEEGDLPDLHRQVQGITEEIERIIEQLQQREREVYRAEQLAAVGQVAAGVAHELRNPLTSVKMLVQTGMEQSGSGLSRDELGIMEREIRRMEKCIQVFLDFARPPASERRPSDLVGVIDEAIALIEGRARRQKIDIEKKFPDQAVRLNIDPEQIRQVLINLFLNAIDAMPRGGRLSIELARRAGGDGETVEVSVRDTGCGIAPRIQERLFEPFVSSKDSGLGLGLSICKRLIETHGGTIHGENLPTGGARFTFSLPARKAAATARPQGKAITVSDGPVIGWCGTPDMDE